MTERINKKGGRHYKRPSDAETPAVAALIPMVRNLLVLAFPPKGADSPSVTTILGALAKPALVGWAAREERKKVAYIASQLYAKLGQIAAEPMDPAKFYEMLVEEAGKPANREILATAAQVGTEVHKRIEWELKGELGQKRAEQAPLLTSKHAQNSWDRWQEWRKAVKLKVLRTEGRIFSTLFSYGGTFDVLAEVTRTAELPGGAVPVTETVVIDFKTGKSVYAESFLQNIGYRMALLEEGVKTQGGIIVRLPKYEEDPAFDAVDVPNDPTLGPTFIALTIVHRWVAAEKDKYFEDKRAKEKADAESKLPETTGGDGEHTGDDKA